MKKKCQSTPTAPGTLGGKNAIKVEAGWGVDRELHLITSSVVIQGLPNRQASKQLPPNKVCKIIQAPLWIHKDRWGGQHRAPTQTTRKNITVINKIKTDNSTHVAVAYLNPVCFFNKSI